MAVKKNPVTFTASDGKEFSDEESAKKHDAFVTALREWEQAGKRLNAAGAQRFKTADGEHLKIGRWGDYWHINPFAPFGPELTRVSFSYGTNFQMDWDGDAVEIVSGHGKDERRATYRISELYADEKKARVALMEAWEKHVADVRERFEKMKRQ